MASRREHDLTPPPQEIAARGAEALRAAMLEYYAAEKREALVFLVVGLFTVVVAILLARGAVLERAMGYPLVAVGLVQLAVGGVGQVRAGRKLAAVEAALARDEEACRGAEIPRMRRVIAGFRLYQTIEIALLALGLALTFGLRARPALHALGIGLVVQSSVMILLDRLAQRRAARYAAALEDGPPA